MKGKITYPEIQPAGAGHAFRNSFILQGHLTFHVVGLIIKNPAAHNIDNATGNLAHEFSLRAVTARRAFLQAGHA